MLEKIGLPTKPAMRGSNWVVDASHCQGCSSQFTFINRKVSLSLSLPRFGLLCGHDWIILLMLFYCVESLPDLIFLKYSNFDVLTHMPTSIELGSLVLNFFGW